MSIQGEEGWRQPCSAVAHTEGHRSETTAKAKMGRYSSDEIGPGSLKPPCATASTAARSSRGQARAAPLEGQPGEHLHPAPTQGGKVSGMGQAHQGSVPLLLPALEYCKYLP